MNRLLDANEQEIRERTSLVADYIRALRLLGCTSPALERAWRQMCITVDPLASPDRAVAQLRLYLDEVENRIGQVPQGFPQVDYVACENEDDIRVARRSWADQVMKSVLDLGSRRAPVLFGGSATGGAGERNEEPLAEPLSAADEAVVAPSSQVVLSSEGQNSSNGGGGGSPSGPVSLSSTRVVQVFSKWRDYGPFEVTVEENATGYMVMSQVVDHLRAFISVPPLPRWIFVGPNKKQGELISPSDPFWNLVSQDEIATIQCLEPDYGNSKRLIADRLQTTHDQEMETFGDFVYVQVPKEGHGHRRRRKTKRDQSLVEGSDQVGVVSGDHPPRDSKRRHGWNAERLTGWDVQPPDTTQLPEWVGDIVTQINNELGPFNKAMSTANVQDTRPSLRLGEIGALSGSGRQAIVRLMNQIGRVRDPTLHIKLPFGGERIFEAATYNFEMAMMIVAIADEIAMPVVAFGSQIAPSWDLVLTDKFDTQSGHVVILQVSVKSLKQKVTDDVKRQRPRTPSRSPKRKFQERSSGRRVFGLGGSNDAPASKDRGAIGSGGNSDSPPAKDCQVNVAIAGPLHGASSCGQGTMNGQGFACNHGSIAGAIATEVANVGEISPTLGFTVDEGERFGVGESSEVLHPLEEQLSVDWSRVVNHAIETNRVYSRQDRIFNLDGLSWVAVHEGYMPFFPPLFGDGHVFADFEWAPVCFPSLPQELASFQAQWERWSLGQVGFDKRTNVSVRYLQRDRLGYWTCQFCTGQTCFLAVHSDYEDWGQIFPGDALIAFQVHQIGCYKGCPLIAVPKIGSGSSLIKQPAGIEIAGTPVTVYELFAGIGGWSAGLAHLGSHVVVAVELCPQKAQILAEILQVPCVQASQLRPHHLEQSVVIQGDVRDPTWFHASLVLPAKLVLWSAPCVTWSAGGRLRGLSAEEGLLLLDSIGLCGLFSPPISVGENVLGLVSHPDWDLVRLFAQAILGSDFQVLKACLRQLVPMARNRIFLLQGPYCPVLPKLRLNLDDNAWLLGSEDQVKYCQLKEVEKDFLSQRELLPDSLKGRAPPYLLDKQVLELRVVSTDALPTLVASYRYQCELHQDHLLARGLYTWLLDSSLGPRYIDAFEAAWILGFGPSLRLPASPQVAMNCVGNCVAPVQVLQILFLVWPHLQPNHELPSFDRLLRAMVFGKPPLQAFCRFACEGVWILGFQPLARCLPDPKCLLLADLVCAPFQLETNQGFSQEALWKALNVAWTWLPTELQVYFEDDFVLVFADLRKVRVLLHGCCLLVSPLCQVGALQTLLNQVTDNYQHRLWNPDQPLSNTEGTIVRLELQVRMFEDSSVVFLVGLRLRVVEFVPGETVLEAVDRAFPFRLRSFVRKVWNCRTAAFSRERVLFQPVASIRCGSVPGSFLFSPLDFFGSTRLLP